MKSEDDWGINVDQDNTPGNIDVFEEFDLKFENRKRYVDKLSDLVPTERSVAKDCSVAKDSFLEALEGMNGGDVEV